jgi:CubicO group peptidase (beta-lactamase class C family)
MTEMKLHDYFQEHILKPLGVENFGFWFNQAMMDNLIKMHLRQPDGGIIEIPHTETAAKSPVGTKGSCSGGGGCYGTLREYTSEPFNFRSTLRAISTSTVDADCTSTRRNSRHVAQRWHFAYHRRPDPQARDCQDHAGKCRA